MLGLALFVQLTAGHVPTYDGCTSACCAPPHHHDTSQVIYLKGTGGLELHLEDLDIAGGEILDVDAVFKESYDPSTYALYVGCGGCVPEVDEIAAPRVSVGGYEPGTLEPFTQTSYRSIWKKHERKFNTSTLATCTQGHFTIRLVDYGNSSKTIVWGAVIGLGESFTVTELLSFPIYVLRNHGSVWNGLPWTVYVTALVAWSGWWFDRRFARTCFGWRWVNPWDAELVGFARRRALLYDLAIVAFIWSALEMFVHLCVAQATSEFGYEFWAAFVGVLVIAHGIPIAYTFVLFWSVYHPDYVVSRPIWTPLEAATAFAILFFFGAGFYVAPVLLFFAAVVRGLEAWSGRAAPYAPLTSVAPAAPAAPDDEPVVTGGRLPLLEL